jgi:hypothetical protein
MKKIKYPNILPAHYELIKSAPNEFYGVLSYGTLKYIYEETLVDIPNECLEIWLKIQAKVDKARRCQEYGKRGGYYLHKKEPIADATSVTNKASSNEESPVKTQKLVESPARALTTTISNINNNINTNNILREKIETKKEKSLKVTNTAKTPEFIPPTIEELTEFFTSNGYTAEAATKCYHYYADGDWIDSQGRPVQNWKRKVRFNWFKPEYLQVKGSVYTRSQYRPA